MGYEDSPLMQVCVCSHTVRRHEDGVCKAAGCGCAALRVDAAPSPATKAGRVARVEISEPVSQCKSSRLPAPVFTVGEQGPEPLGDLERVLSKPGRARVEDLKFESTDEPLDLDAVVPVATHPDGEPAEALYCPGAGGDCDRGCVVGGGCSRLDELEADPVVPVQARVVPADDARWLIDRGLASPVKSTRDLAGNVQAGLDGLRRIVEEEAVARVAERAELAARLRDLEAELEAARRAFVGLGGVLADLATPDSVPTSDAVEHRCPECGEVKSDARALGGHRYHKHGVRKAAKPA